MVREPEVSTPPRNKFRILKDKLQAIKSLKSQQAKPWLIEVDVPLSPRYEFIEKPIISPGSSSFSQINPTVEDFTLTQGSNVRIDKSIIDYQRNMNSSLQILPNCSSTSTNTHSENITNLNSTRSNLNHYNDSYQSISNISANSHQEKSDRSIADIPRKNNNFDLYSPYNKKDFFSLRELSKQNLKNNKSEPTFPNPGSSQSDYPDFNLHDVLNSSKGGHHYNLNNYKNVYKSENELPNHNYSTSNTSFLNDNENRKYPILNIINNERNSDIYFQENYELITENDYSSSAPRYFSKKIVGDYGFMVNNQQETSASIEHRETMVGKAPYLAENGSSPFLDGFNFNKPFIKNPNYQNTEESTYYPSRKNTSATGPDSSSFSSSDPSSHSNNAHTLTPPRFNFNPNTITHSSSLANLNTPFPSPSPKRISKSTKEKSKSSNRKKRVVYGKLCEGLQTLNYEKKSIAQDFPSIPKSDQNISIFTSLPENISNTNDNFEFPSPINPFSDNSPVFGFNSEIFLESKNSSSNLQTQPDPSSDSPLGSQNTKAINGVATESSNNKISALAFPNRHSESTSIKLDNYNFLYRKSHPGNFKNMKSSIMRKSITRRMDIYTIDIPSNADLFTPNRSNTNSLKSYYDRLGVSDLIQMFPTEINNKRHYSLFSNTGSESLIIKPDPIKHTLSQKPKKYEVSEPASLYRSNNSIKFKTPRNLDEKKKKEKQKLNLTTEKPNLFAKLSIYTDNKNHKSVASNDEFLWYTSMDNSYKETVNRNLGAVLNKDITRFSSHSDSSKSPKSFVYNNKSGLAIKNPTKYYNRISLETTNSESLESSRSNSLRFSSMSKKRKSLINKASPQSRLCSRSEGAIINRINSTASHMTTSVPIPSKNNSVSSKISQFSGSDCKSEIERPSFSNYPEFCINSSSSSLQNLNSTTSKPQYKSYDSQLNDSLIKDINDPLTTDIISFFNNNHLPLNPVINNFATNPPAISTDNSILTFTNGEAIKNSIKYSNSRYGSPTIIILPDFNKYLINDCYKNLNIQALFVNMSHLTIQGDGFPLFKDKNSSIISSILFMKGKWIKHLPSLESLGINNIGLDRIPEYLHFCKNIRSLDLSSNQIKHIDTDFESINLKMVNLTYNPLNIPSIKKLVNISFKSKVLIGYNYNLSELSNNFRLYLLGTINSLLSFHCNYDQVSQPHENCVNISKTSLELKRSALKINKNDLNSYFETKNSSEIKNKLINRIKSTMQTRVQNLIKDAENHNHKDYDTLTKEVIQVNKVFMGLIHFASNLEKYQIDAKIDKKSLFVQ
ncbi:hypothetical protein AYI69_g6074 [Smittium culicis]|uniref:Uncharacterized protein n=1 Tax=Smittium culicis TaxID=133412 RepID=A0A1R1Y1W6_9FUNG|nr:hypothetical protein AYI69_g6074 [Smittium culicis]